MYDHSEGISDDFKIGPEEDGWKMFSATAAFEIKACTSEKSNITNSSAQLYVKA